MIPTICIVDDEVKIRTLLGRIFAYEKMEALEAADLKIARKLLASSEIDVLVCDVKLPDGSGVDFTAEVKRDFPQVEIILLTAFGNIADGVQAIKNGAFDYLVKGDDQEKIIPLVNRALEKARLQKHIYRLEKQLEDRHGFDKVLGDSAAIRQCIQLARKVAPTDTTVLLLGETGVGKEVFARAIHQESRRRLAAFVAVNCSALGHDMLESELFGHRAGAFTGALKDKKGLFEEAHNGAIFLDEIGEMPADLQAKILRVLEDGTFLKVGDTKETQVNVRIIAATNRDLEKEIRSGGFREDLWFRLSVFPIRLPSLAERLEDLPVLISHFVFHFAAKANRRPPAVSAAFLKALQTHAWRGNIRELRNVIERAVLLCDGDTLTPDLIFSSFQSVAQAPTELTLAAAEKAQIQRALDVAKGNKTQAARLLDIGLTTLYQKLKDYGI